MLMSKPFPIYYEIFGNPKDPCVILVMGMGGQLIQWPSLFVQGLVDQGFCVVTFDNRDIGLSRYYDELEAPDLNEILVLRQQGKSFHAPYTLEDMSSDVIVLMDELRIEKAYIAGISMGGMIAQIVAFTCPERVLGLICIASTSGDPALPPPKQEVLECFFSPQKADDVKMHVNHRMRLHRIYVHPDYVDEEKDRTLYKKLYQRAHHPVGFKRQLVAVAYAGSRVEKLKLLQVPTLVIHGDNDPAFPIEHAQQLAQVIPNAHLEVIEKMGHGLPDCLCKKVVDLIVKYFK
jgi:pimeloyl-ACP methyl ester carboxylesterase